MKPSLFNIVQEIDGQYLIYNTFSTAMVEMESDLYESIFVRNESFYSDEAAQLVEMGFLVSDETDEAEEQKQIRETVLATSSEYISNIIIAPTLACNANCFYCFENGHRKGMMTVETARAVVQFIKAHWNGEKIGITWFGGEPLLAPDIIECMISELNQQKIPFSSKITTNGSLLTEEMIQRIQSSWNVDKIQITIDAVGEEYNRIKNYTGISDAFSLIIRNIHHCLNASLPIRVRINFDPEKMETAVSTMSYLTEEFAAYSGIKIYFAPIDEDDCVVRNITDSFSDHDEHPYIKLIKYGRMNGLYRGFPDMEDDSYEQEFDSHGLLKKLKIYPQPINCYASCQNVFSIDCNGDLYKCHRALGRKEYSSGNVFGGIAENEVYRYFCNTDAVLEECNHCPILPICQGGCKINLKLFAGKGCCAPSKAIINELVRLYREDLSRERRDEYDSNQECSEG